MTACRVCALEPRLLQEVEAQHRRGVSLRTMESSLALNGHGEVRKDALHRHLRSHADPSAPDPEATPDTLTFAVVVSDAGRKWPGLLREVGERLVRYGMHDEADIVLAQIPDHMRAALQAAGTTDASELLQARAFARAVRDVLRVRHPEAARDIADQLAREELTDMAGAFYELAEHASSVHVVDNGTQEQRSGAKATPRLAAGSAPDRPTTTEVTA